MERLGVGRLDRGGGPVRYIVAFAVQGQRAGAVLDDTYDSPQVISSLREAGVLVALPNSVAESAAVQARRAYAAGGGDEIANLLMASGLSDPIAAKGRNVVWSNGPGDAKTWEDVMNIVALDVFGCDVCPSTDPEGVGSMNIEPAGVYDFKRGRFVAPYVGANGANVSTVAGVELRNVSMLVGTTVHLVEATMAWDLPAPGSPVVLICQFGGNIQNDGASPAIRMPDGNNPLIIGTILGGGLSPSASPIVSLGPNAILWTVTVNSTTGSTISPGTVVSDDASSLVVHGHTGSFDGFPSNPGFLGTQINVPLGHDGGSGPTTARPSALLIGGTLPPGWKFYDTTIDKPIVVNAANAWVDYAGNPV